MTACARSVAALAVGLTLAASAAAQAAPLEFNGSLKTVLLRARTSSGGNDTLSLNRLRAELKGEFAPGLAFDLQYDNELLLGSYLQGAEFRALAQRPPLQYWRAESNYLERAAVYGRHRLHRAALTLSRAALDLKLGRQRIAWGTGRFWSPLDILNPVNPLALEREERPGVDAALFEAKLGALSRASLVYAPAPDRGAPSRAAHWHGNAAGVDASVVVGRLLGLETVGMDMASQLGASGIRAELVHLRPAAGAAFRRVMLGADHAWVNGLTLSAELYYNGAGAHGAGGQGLAPAQPGPLASRGRRYLGLYAAYELTPLLKWVSQVLLNLEDHSRAIDSRLVWAFDPAMDLLIGVMRRGGAAGSEFANAPQGVQLQLQWFFKS